jgi:hypothetical protein
MGMLLDTIREQLRQGKEVGVARINARNRAAGSEHRAYLDERGRIQRRRLTPEELEAEARELEITGEEEDEEEDTEGA